MIPSRDRSSTVPIGVPAISMVKSDAGGKFAEAVGHADATHEDEQGNGAPPGSIVANSAPSTAATERVLLSSSCACSGLTSPAFRLIH